jgi:hypothetical protein
VTVPRLIIGNIYCEAEFAHDSGLNPRVLKVIAIAKAAALATLLRVFADDDDLLWTPVPVDPDRMPEVEGLPRPRLVSGPLKALPRAEIVLAWGETEAVARLRSDWRAAPDPRFPPADPTVAARVNHREFRLTEGAGIEAPLPGTKMLTCVPELEYYLTQLDPPPAKWVLKAPWSSAGRLRYVGSGPAVEQTARRHVIDLFYRFNELLFEPWVPRTADFGVSGSVEEATLRHHRLSVERYGQFAGLVFRRDGFPEATFAVEGAKAVRELLKEHRYRGPFGTDAFLYTDADGRTATRAVSEINARLTFGHVAHALGERLPGLADREGYTFAFGVSEDGPDRIPLLLPDPEETTEAGVLLLPDGVDRVS